MDCIYQACSCVMMDVPREIGFIFCLDLLQTRSTFKPRVKQTIKHYIHITFITGLHHGLVLSSCYPGGYQLSRYHGITPHPAISSVRVTVTSNHDTRGCKSVLQGMNS